jgi:hypothetical protein
MARARIRKGVFSKRRIGEARAKELKKRIEMAIKTLNEAVIDDWDPASGFR